ncbi:MAG: HRDC domain-containing protein [Peptococcaceae bacterium]
MKSLRLMLAIDEGVPSYHILSDETLQELASKQPVSPIALESITGLGQSKIEQYGTVLLQTISQYQQAFHLEHGQTETTSKSGGETV